MIVASTDFGAICQRRLSIELHASNGEFHAMY